MGLTNGIPANGTRLLLSQKSHQGADLLRENGKMWIVIEYRSNVLAFSGKPGILVEAIVTGAWRWLALPDDKQFFFSEVRK